MHVLLVGNPNCGKTTLFNALTGENQKVGNWPGVTVEKKTGAFYVEEKDIQITDLPGIYSLVFSHTASQDEQITASALVNLDFDLIINVVDACHLERHLYLTSQLFELGKPIIVALNMLDVASQRGINIVAADLAQRLNCPVVEMQAHRKKGLAKVSELLSKESLWTLGHCITWSDELTVQLEKVNRELLALGESSEKASYKAVRILEGDEFLNPLLAKKFPAADILMADQRYSVIHHIVKETQKKQSDTSEHLTAKLDKVFLHRFWSLPIFLGVMYCMFLFAINVGGAFQDFFDLSSNALFVQTPALLLKNLHAPEWVIALLANGVGKGINTTLTFIPVIAAMFFFLSFLESSGYMARAAFIVDRVMRALGLPGKSFVPMIVGFGCNVPAIMAARTLDSERERFLTVLMSPFMSCSARLAIYAVFVAAFFPSGGANVVFSLYFIGIGMAVLTGFLLKKTFFRGQPSPLILELPAYHKPGFRRLWQETYRRLKHFIFKAGKLIIPVCLVLGSLNTLTIHGTIQMGSSDSLLCWIAQRLTPIFSPMGIHHDNWPATVGLMSGMLAKEVVVGSLNSLYLQMDGVMTMVTSHFNLWTSLKTAIYTIPQNLAELGSALLNPISAGISANEMAKSVYGIMYQHFDGKIGAYAYLLFVLLYIPCVSTMAVIRQETNRTLMWFSIGWSLLAAYSAAVLFYQIATIQKHPSQTLVWISIILGLLTTTILGLKKKAALKGSKHAVANS